MILVYPLIPAINDNVELRYSLRSMAAALPKVERVIVIGHKPDWLVNVEHYDFPLPGSLRQKQLNIFHKLVYAFCVTDFFLYCNDDHFINPSFDIYKYYANDEKISEMLPRAGGLYKQTIQNTIDFIGDQQNFDVHCPMYMQKYRFEHQFKDAPIIKPNGLLLKTVYAHFFVPYKYKDLKIKGWFDPDELSRRDYFSVAESGVTNYFLTTLQKMFPNKSKYEK